MKDGEKTPTQPKRLLSLDVFRGLTIAAMILVNNPGSWNYVYPPLLHAKWHGWTFTDLIFPFFLFIVGVAVVFSFQGQIQKGIPKSSLYIKIIRRTLILFVLGLFLSGFPYFDFSSIRIMGVLQRIAICYLIATIIFLNSSIRGQALWAVGLLFLYWALMEWIPVPEVGAGLYDAGKNFAAYFDQLILEGHMWKHTKTWDPEGIITTIPAISTTIFGILTGHLLKSENTALQKTVWMLVAGNTALFIGMVWNSWMPINKNLWTSSYAVFMAGMALICLGICYFFLDVRGNKRGIQPALVYGMNSITVFVLSGIVAKLLIIIKITIEGETKISLWTWLYQTLFTPWLGNLNGSLAFALCFITIMYILMWLLYRKRIFIKI